MAEFCGWVPTITGHLSFSTIGLGRNPRKLFKRFMSVGGQRYTVVCQKRRISDSLFGPLGDFINYLGGREGYSVYTFIGECSSADGYDLLQGPCIELTLNEYRQLKPHFSELSTAQPDVFDEVFRKFAMEVASRGSSRLGAVCAVSLVRSGQITIMVDDDEIQSANQQKLIASQAYFFMRDISHLHQHHAPTTDTILDVTPLADGTDAWKRETLYSLYRWVIQQKRAKSEAAFLGAQGVLAYAKAFEMVHCNPLPKDLPKYLHEPTLASVEAGIEQSSYIERTRSSFSNAIFTKVIPFAGLAIAALSPLYSEPSGEQVSADQAALAIFAGWFNENILKVFFTCFMVPTIFHLSVTLRGRYLRSDKFLDLMRFLFTIRYGVVLSIFGLLFIACIILSYASFSAMSELVIGESVPTTREW